LTANCDGVIGKDTRPPRALLLSRVPDADRGLKTDCIRTKGDGMN